jgi:anaerobic magnesium-protoporphyrin IX monomethyl ester cyclase
MGIDATMNSCLLIIPPFRSGKGSILKSFNYTMPPIGLLSIAAWLRQHDIRVSLLDFTIENTEKFKPVEILDLHCREHGVPQWIGISVCTPVANAAYAIADVCKKKYPLSQIVLGGPHVTVIGEKVFSECRSADYLVGGEGEYALCKLIKHQDHSSPNLVSRKEIHCKVMKEGPPVDLSLLPMPAYDLLKFERYVPPPSSLQSRQPGIGIMTTRDAHINVPFVQKFQGPN